MRIEEAIHIKRKLKKFTGKSSKLEVVLNLGSSTEFFRKTEQPHIDKFLLQPLDNMKYKVIHFDLKSNNGVDISGDIFSKNIQKKLKKLNPSIILCCNLLEHLEENSRNGIRTILNNLLGKNGILLMTVPYSYPLHLDPIDTYYRPSPKDLIQLFYGYDVLDESIIESTSFLDEYLSYKVFKKIKIWIRLFMPFYKFKEWRCLAHRFLWLLRSYKISCIMIKKK